MVCFSPAGEILKALARDKKNLHGELRFVLPLRIGKAVIKKIPANLAMEGYRSLCP